MAAPPDRPQGDVYAALNERFANQGLLEFFPDGLIAGEEIPGTTLPYAVMDPGSDAVMVGTASGEYAGGTLTISLYDKTFDLAKRWAGLVRRALRWAPLPLNPSSGLTVKHCKPGAVRYMQEETFWKAVLEFDILTGEAVNRSPAPGQQA